MGSNSILKYELRQDTRNSIERYFIESFIQDIKGNALLSTACLCSVWNISKQIFGYVRNTLSEFNEVSLRKNLRNADTALINGRRNYAFKLLGQIWNFYDKYFEKNEELKNDNYKDLTQ